MVFGSLLENLMLQNTLFCPKNINEFSEKTAVFLNEK